MRTYGVQNWVAAVRVEIGADSEYIQRVPEEGLLHAFASWAKEAAFTLGVFISDRDMLATAVDELCTYYFTRADLFAVEILFLINDTEAVALSRIEQEVDYATKHIGHAHDDIGGDVGSLCGQEQAV